MKPFVINRHGRLVFPANVQGELDFGVLRTMEQFTAVIERDFEAKAPTGTEILGRTESGAYPGRFELLRDLGQNLFWVNRYSITMFEKRPTRWRDLAKNRDDVFLPVLTPWADGDRKVAAVERAYRDLPATWDGDTEDKIFGLLFDLFRNKLHHATELPAIKPTVAEFLAQPDALTFVMPDHDPDYPVFRAEEILDANEEVPELEALMRWAMVLHNQYPWARSRTELRRAADIGDDDFVVAFHPADRDVMAFIDRVRSARTAAPVATAVPRQEPVETVAPETPYPPVRVREAFAVQPVIEALAVVRGEHICTNADVIRNASFSWSPMSAADIAARPVSRSAATPAGSPGSSPSPPRGPRWRSPAGHRRRSGRCWSARAPATGWCRRWPAGSPGSWACSRPTPRSTWWRPARGCPTGWPRPSGSCRRSGGRSC